MSPSPSNSFKASDDGVSEVVGQSLTFGILAMVLLLALVAFGRAQEAVHEGAAGSQADVAAARVGQAAVETGLLAEALAGSERAAALFVDLPGNIEGHSYVVRLVPSGLGAAHVRVTIPDLEREGLASLLSLEATGIGVCGPVVSGGPVWVRIGAPASGTPTLPAGCTESQLWMDPA